MIQIEDLKVGDEVWTGDGYGYDRVKVIEALHNKKDYPFPIVTVQDLDTNEIMDLGGVKGYVPSFYPKDW